MDPFSPEALKNPASIYLLLGTESLLVKNAEEAVTRASLSGGFASLNHGIFHAGEEPALGFAAIASTLPMMAPRRLVVLRQIQEASVALLESLMNYVQSPSPTTVLVITGEKMPAAVGGVDRGIRISNAIKKSGVFARFDGEGTDPVQFAIQQAKTLGVSLERDAAAKLRVLVGDDLTGIAGELEKLAGYVGAGGRIDMAAVDAMCSSSADTEVWALTNALVGRNRAAALEAMHRLLEDGEAPHRLMVNVTWQIRQMLILQDVIHRNLPERDAGLRMPPNVARAMRETLQKVTLSPASIMEELAVANRRMNSSRAGDRRTFEALVLRLTVLEERR